MTPLFVCAILVAGILGTILLNVFGFESVVQEMFKYISYLDLWQPLNSAEQNLLCNFCRWHHEEQYCKIILNLDQWFTRRCCLKTFLI